MAYEVKSGVPIPAGALRNGKYPLLSMNVGDCFFVDQRYKPLVLSKAIRSTGKKFRQIVKPEIEGKVFDGLCVWRTV